MALFVDRLKIKTLEESSETPLVDIDIMIESNDEEDEELEISETEDDLDENMDSAIDIQEDLMKLDAIKTALTEDGYTKTLAIMCDTFGVSEYARSKNYSLAGIENLTDNDKSLSADELNKICDELTILGTESLGTVLKNIGASMSKFWTLLKQRWQRWNVILGKNQQLLKGTSKDDFNSAKLTKKLNINTKKDVVAMISLVKQETSKLEKLIKELGSEVTSSSFKSKIDEDKAVAALSKYEVHFEQILVRLTNAIKKPSKQDVTEAGWDHNVSNITEDLRRTWNDVFVMAAVADKVFTNKFTPLVSTILGTIGRSYLHKINMLSRDILKSARILQEALAQQTTTLIRVSNAYVFAKIKK